MKAVDLLLRPRNWQEDAKKLTFRVTHHPGKINVIKRVRRMPDMEGMTLIKEILHWRMYEEFEEFEN